MIKNTPIPLPRPVMEEIVPGGENPGIKLDIPIPEMADIDLSYPLIGLDWVVYPWTLTKGLTMELMTRLSDLTNLELFEWLELSLLTAALAVVAGGIFLAFAYVVRKFW